MQKVKLPLTIDAQRATQKNLDYVGSYKPKQVTRTAESVVTVDSDVETELSFNIYKQRLTVIEGNSDVDVTLQCQRCRKDFKYHAYVLYCFSPVVNYEKAEALPEGYEPVQINEFGELPSEAEKPNPFAVLASLTKST